MEQKMGWINLFNLIIVILLLVPNIIYAVKNKHMEIKPQNRAISILEQIGRYGSMFFMVFDIGIPKFGFRSNEAFVIWLFCNGMLLLLYWLIWIFYFRQPKLSSGLSLAIIPGGLFLLNGLFLGHWLLILFAAVFCIAHVYIVYHSHDTK